MLTVSPNWQRFNGQKIEGSLLDAIETILIKEQHKGHKIKVCVGTDSQVKGDFVVFATVILFLRIGKGGFMLTHKKTYETTLHINRRMVMEVTDSVEIGSAISDLLELYDVEMEIHADVNASKEHLSNKAFKEVMGYVMGSGLVFIAKPDACASTYCADKVVKGGSWPKKKVA
ncbi:hypothetical protein KA013_05185 [Patescibacteria group bacterium]|nr:hypothetical protein [Patescibacteria group bacterium]